MNDRVRAKKVSSSRKAVSAVGDVRAVVMAESEMWASKRKNQRRDIAGLNSGELSNDDVNWFAGGVARKAKVIGSLV
jgi:hypothetical protein